MAVKIIKQGQTEFHGFCKWCGCEFTYEISDLKLSAVDKVSCPTCGKDYYHPAMVQDPTIPGGIGLKWPPDPIPCIGPNTTQTDPCAGCAWKENLLRDGLYVGDTPCTWCNKNHFNSITSVQPSIADYTTPCVNELSTSLATSASNEISSTKYALYNNCAENNEDITQGTVMSTIINTCTDCVNNLNKCDDTEGRNSCSGEYKCNNKKNCKGKH